MSHDEFKRLAGIDLEKSKEGITVAPPLKFEQIIERMDKRQAEIMKLLKDMSTTIEKIKEENNAF